MMKRFLLFAPVIVAMALYFKEPSVEWRSGNYQVAWLDNDLSLYLSLDDSNGIGRVMHKVVAIGEDSKWIVVQREPRNSASVEYYYFSKSHDHRFKNADEATVGPLSLDAFEQVKSEHNLPDFTKKF